MKGFLTLAAILFWAIAVAQPQKVNVNGTNFNVLVKGLDGRAPKAPVIILENGMGVDLNNWDKVFDQLVTIAPVLAYDRAGIGKSDNQYKLPTAKLVTDNLHGILKALNIAPPYILVGHSMGGVYIRGYAGYYPKDIAGLVFVDPADFTETKNDWNNIFRKLGLPEQQIEQMLVNRLYRSVPITDSVDYGLRSERQVLNELRKSDFAEIAGLPLPKVPVYFFVGGKFDVPKAQRSKEYDQEAFFHIKNNSNMERWRKIIHSTEKAGALIYLTNAGHYIQWDDPRSLIDNIKIMVANIKN